MMAEVRFTVHYGTNDSGTYAITVDAADLPDDGDWLHLFYENVPPEVAEIVYSVEWTGCRYM